MPAFSLNGRGVRVPIQVLPEEITPGDVIHLHQNVLVDSTAVEFSAYRGDEKPRPHLCVARNRHFSAWTSITSEHKDERLRIKFEWRQGGIPAWHNSKHVYLYDGAFLVVGPTSVFCDAAQGVEVLEHSKRARISKEGLREVLWEIDRQKGRRPANIPGVLESLGLSLVWDPWTEEE